MVRVPRAKCRKHIRGRAEWVAIAVDAMAVSKRVILLPQLLATNAPRPWRPRRAPAPEPAHALATSRI